MLITEEERKKLTAEMKQFGYMSYIHPFFYSREYEIFRNTLIDTVNSDESDFDMTTCDISDVLKAGKNIVFKHTKSSDIKVPYTSSENLLLDIIQKYGDLPKDKDFNDIYKYIENCCKSLKVTDIPVETQTEEKSIVSGIYLPSMEDMDFYDNLPLFAEKIKLTGACNDLMKIAYVYEMYKTLIDSRKKNVINMLNREMVPIFMEKVAAFDLDPTLELLNISNIRRLISLKGNVLKRELCLNYQKGYLDTIVNEGYILSTLEATALFDTYQKSFYLIKREINSDINSVLNGEKLLETVIDKYEATPEKGAKLVKRQVKKLF